MEWLNNSVCYKQRMKRYSAIKGNVQLHATTWMHPITLSERYETQKVTHCMIHLHEMSRRGKSIVTKSSCQEIRVRMSGTAWDRVLIGMGFPFVVMEIFWNNTEVMVAQYSKYTKKCCIVLF